MGSRKRVVSGYAGGCQEESIGLLTAGVIVTKGELKVETAVGRLPAIVTVGGAIVVVVDGNLEDTNGNGVA